MPEYHAFVTTFLCSYKAYLTPRALLGHLTSVYTMLCGTCLSQPQPLAIVGERILYVLNVWARDHFDDFDHYRHDHNFDHYGCCSICKYESDDDH